MKYLYVNGCSLSAGIELELEKRFGYLTAKKLGLEEINQALASGSNDRIFRKTFSWIANNQDKIHETIFLIQWSDPGRMEVFHGDISKFPHVDDTSMWNTTTDGDFYDWAQKVKGLKVYTPDGQVRGTNYWFNALNHFEELVRVNAERTIRYIVSLQNYFENNNLQYIMFYGLYSSIREASDETRALIDQDNFLYFGEYRDFHSWSKEFYGLMPESHPNEAANEAFSNILVECVEKKDLKYEI
jgi:hypothetical protein